MVNILMRTSNRPKGFARTINGLKKQTDQNFKLIVSVDNDETELYVKNSNYDCEVIRVQHEKRNHPDHNPYNLYVNDLIDRVTDGWYVVIDDDDIILENLVSSINNICWDDDSVYIFKIDFMGKEIPSHSFGKSITFGDISSPCIVMNFKNKDIAKWKPVRGGDFNYIKDIVESGKLRVNFVNECYYRIIKPGAGLREDI